MQKGEWRKEWCICHRVQGFSKVTRSVMSSNEINFHKHNQTKPFKNKTINYCEFHKDISKSLHT